MTPDERERFSRWCARHLPAYAIGLLVSLFLGFCQTLNILDGDNSGDEGWLLTVLLVTGPTAADAAVVWTYRLAPRANRALVRARRKSPHRPETDLREVYRG